MSDMPADVGGITDPRLRQFYWMILARYCDERTRSLYRQGQIAASAFMSRGQEAVAAAMGMALRPGDLLAPYVRDLAGRLAFGEPLVEGFRNCLGRSTGVMRGRDGNVHRGDVSRGILPFLSHLGAMVAPAAGVLLARRLRDGRDTTVAAVAMGDGGMATGACNEGLNAAGVDRLPLVMIVANNRYAYSTTNDRGFACKDLLDRAPAFGFEGAPCDGTDFDDCRRVVSAAFERARSGRGPQMVVATFLRLCGHGEHDDFSYLDPALARRYGDCVVIARTRLLAEGVIDAVRLQRLEARALAAVDEACRTALSEPAADPSQETWQVYADPQIRAAAVSEGWA